MLRILILGATSAIAEATARRYAQQGAALCLAGRDLARLEAIAADLRVRGAAAVHAHRLDIADLAAHAGALDAAWAALGEVDVALVAHGTLPDQAACDASVATALEAFAINGTATVALSLALAQRLRAPATLAVISSVAGDRGRGSNLVYGAAKAAVTACLSGLRQRLHASGVNVLTIKPGFVDTPMTAAFRKGALWATPDAIARGIVRAVERRASVAYLPWFWWGIMRVITHIPESIFRRLKL
jgi:decaprenylphospho-beta-D-erythro-pentofuranosid-2-ulose 2-reductase